MNKIENLTTIELHALYTTLFDEISRLKDNDDENSEYQLSILEPLFDKINKALDTALDNM